MIHDDIFQNIFTFFSLVLQGILIAFQVKALLGNILSNLCFLFSSHERYLKMPNSEPMFLLFVI